VVSEQLKQFDGDVLVIHAPDDREVPFASGEAMGKAGPHVAMLPTPGLGHRRIIADEKVLVALTQFGSAHSIAAAA
jgi:pimeloyl-ACP methyl ester carboxylesterase